MKSGLFIAGVIMFLVPILGLLDLVDKTTILFGLFFSGSIVTVAAVLANPRPTTANQEENLSIL